MYHAPVNMDFVVTVHATRCRHVAAVNTCLRSMVMVTHWYWAPFWSVGLCHHLLVPSIALVIGCRRSTSPSSQTCRQTRRETGQWQFVLTGSWVHLHRTEEAARTRAPPVCSRLLLLSVRRWRYSRCAHPTPSWTPMGTALSPVHLNQTKSSSPKTLITIQWLSAWPDIHLVSGLNRIFDQLEWF